MKNFFSNLGYKIQRFMVGRYGADQLWRALIIFYLIAILITNIVYRFSKIAYYSLSVLSLAIIVFAVFRVFSKNIEARRKENQEWLKITGGIRQKFIFAKERNKQRKTHKFVKCKQCKKVLRLPKNKGKLNVSCPHCKNQFVVNTGKKM
ncbi:MAG: hypothetical protein K2G73_03975 [Eubacterium sp.]|nr:hypothetical protein [Eubacterium sp.]